MINSKLYIFLENSYVLKFKVDGNLENIVKLPSKLKSQPVLIEKNLIFFDYKNRVSIINQLFDLPLNNESCFTFKPFKLSWGLIGYSPVK